MRLDRFLADRLPGASRAAVRRLLATGSVRVDGKARAKGDRVRLDEVVEVSPSGPLSATEWHPMADHDIEVPVLHADEDLLVVSKPAGMPCHPLRSDERGCVANALVARYPELIQAGDVAREAGLVHRLDTVTSGVLVFARRPESFAQLVRQVRGEGALKVYLALVEGDATGISRRLDFPLVSRGRRVVALTGDDTRRAALDATTEVEPLEVLGDVTLIEARIHAGRRHQIRAHLAAAGYPIVGDARYGASGVVRADRPFLHALRIELISPSHRTPLVVEAPLPPDLAAVLEALRRAAARVDDRSGAPDRDPSRGDDEA